MTANDPASSLKDAILQGFFRVLQLCGIVVCLFTLFGLLSRVFWVFELFVHFTVQYAVILLLISLLQLVGRRYIYAMFFAGFCLVNAVPLFSMLSPVEPPTASKGQKLRMVSFNVRSRDHQYQRLAQYVEQVKPDILLLLETNRRWHDNLDSIKKSYPYSVVQTRWDNYGISLYSRYPFTEKDILYLDDVPLPTISARIDINGTPLQVYGIHFIPPIGKMFAKQRNRQIKAMADIARQTKIPTIVAGDMNLTPWSPYFKDLVQQSKLKNSLRGQGLGPSWPTFMPLLGIAIDHILVSQSIVVSQRQIGKRIGSDHYPVVLDMVLPITASKK